MASRVTPQDILEFNKKYYIYHSYAKVAKETGFSATTVSKYIDKDWTPPEENVRKIFNPQSLTDDFDSSIFRGVNNFGTLCVLSKEEEDEIKELWKELYV